MLLTTRLYFVVLFAFLLLGIGAIAYAAAERHAVEEHSATLLVKEVGTQVPKLSALQAAQIRQDLGFWQDRLVTDPLKYIILRDVGIALVVAVFISFALETYARTRLADELLTGVVRAAFKRIIPDIVFDQVRLHVLGANVVKERSAIEMVVRRDSSITDHDEHLYVSRTVLSYLLSATIKRKLTERIRVALDLDFIGVTAEGVNLPRIISVSMGERRLSGNDLLPFLSADKASFDAEAKIGDVPLSVTIVVEEIIRVPDTFVWSTQHCTDRTTIIIDSSAISGIQFDVMALHPEQSRLEERVAGRRWEFATGMLPWQGFQVRSSKTPPLEREKETPHAVPVPQTK